jgi:mRNA interferase MazF
MADPFWIPDRQDMIWIDFDSRASHKEMSGRHPMMVFSSREFTQQTGLVFGIPMTSAEYNRSHRYAIPFEEQGETKFALTWMPKSFVLRARNAAPHPWGKVPSLPFERAQSILERVLRCGV